MSKTQQSGSWRPLQAVQFAPPPLVFVCFLGLTLLLMVVLLLVDRPLQTPAVPKGIVSFEFAGNVDRAREKFALILAGLGYALLGVAARLTGRTKRAGLAG